jgi:hypothetical protein
MDRIIFKNPFRPGAGHMPPYLAGRNQETDEFRKLLEQTVIIDNLVLTGLRGVGKTVLVDTFKPLALQSKWLWVGTELSEATSIREESLVVRLITDIAAITSDFMISTGQMAGFGFTKPHMEELSLDYHTLSEVFKQTPGLISDKLKAILELAWECCRPEGIRGIVFAYDEAQTMTDHPDKEQYPLALLLDVFQSLQKKGIPFMLLLVGLPTLFPRLVESRTFAERMFRVLFLDRLNLKDSRDAISKPIDDAACPVRFPESVIQEIARSSGGYPYFIQFICREAYDRYLQELARTPDPQIDLKKSIQEIIRKLDNDFFAGRWARVTDRQRELLTVIAGLSSCDEEFSVQEVVEASKRLDKPFGASHANQMLVSLADAGLIYKNRHGRYSFAVPLLGQFIRRQQEEREIRKKLELFPGL